MSLTESAIHAHHDDVALAMPSSATASERPAPAAPHEAQLALRLAQRAFAALFEDTARNHHLALTLHTAQLRSAARRTLSTLSADDRSRLVRWLALQIATLDGSPTDFLPERVDAALRARVTAILAHTRETLALPRRDHQIAAA